MILKSAPTVPSNYITDATKVNGNRYLYITSDGNPTNTHVRLSDGTSLGLVQKVNYTLELNELARCTVETIASPAELSALMRDTTVVVKPYGHPLVWLWVYYVAKLRGFCRDTRYLSMFR